MSRHADVENLPTSALPDAGSREAGRWLARALAVGAVVAIFALIFVPWQQSIRGTGRVIAYAPLERQQAIEAPIDARVKLWHVQEGDIVKKGDPIAELSDNDPAILRRLAQERDAAQAQVNAMTVSIAMTQAQIASMETAKDSAISNAQMQTRMSKDRREATGQAVDQATAKLQTAELNLSRQRSLREKGLTSQRDLELAELDEQTARAEVAKAKASQRAANSEVKGYSADVTRVGSSNSASIGSARSSLEKLRADKAKAEAELAKMEIRLAQQDQMQVTAPRNGTILRIVANDGAEMVKAGDPLVQIVPESNAAAVELYVDGNDAPLVEPGRPVRIQFEGWPAVQFVGWPSVAVGTFGGMIAFVDSHDDGNGRFRVVVVPDGNEEWPAHRYLRQGVRANGWVLLNQVSIGFELWRQFNGFPPAVIPTGDKVVK